MSYLKVHLGYKKYNNLKLLERISINKKDSNPLYFKAENQFLCAHLDKIKNVEEFKKFKNKNLNLYYPDYLKYYDINNSKLLFKDETLMSEVDYKSYFEKNEGLILSLYDKHQRCEVCNNIFQKKKGDKKKG